MKIACVGDVCVDIYTNRENMMLVGGNSVNVAVAVKNCGVESSYIGNVGEDPAGKLVVEELKSRGVDVSHVTALPGETAWTEILLQNNDRIFQREDIGVLRQFQLTEDSMEFIATHDLVHFSAFTNWPTAIREMPAYYGMVQHYARRFHQMGLPLTVDFSDMDEERLFSLLHGLVDIAILSRSELTLEECKDFAKKLFDRYQYGFIVVTRGKQGSLAYDGTDYSYAFCGEVEVVDTLGAGDAFAGAFLACYVQGGAIPHCLEEGARYADQICTRFGGF